MFVALDLRKTIMLKALCEMRFEEKQVRGEFILEKFST